MGPDSHWLALSEAKGKRMVSGWIDSRARSSAITLGPNDVGEPEGPQVGQDVVWRL